MSEKQIKLTRQTYTHSQIAPRSHFYLEGKYFFYFTRSHIIIFKISFKHFVGIHTIHGIHLVIFIYIDFYVATVPLPLPILWCPLVRLLYSIAPTVLMLSFTCILVKCGLHLHKKTSNIYISHYPLPPLHELLSFSGLFLYWCFFLRD